MVLSRALIIDDDNLVLKLLSKFLKKKEIEVETALNGEEAIQKLKEKPFDIVLSDLGMPVMDGYKLLAYVKTTNRDVKVMIISGDTFDGVSLLRKGALDALSKPIEIDEFQKRLETLLKEKRRTKRFNSQRVICRIKNNENKILAEGVLENISLDGALVETLKDLKRKNELNIEFSDLRKSNTLAEVKGTVVRKYVVKEDEAPHKIAFYFDSPRDPELLEYFKNHIN